MPITKKKGSLFAIYADTPEKPSSASSSTSSISTKATVPKSPTRSRKALGSLQPKAIEKSTTSWKSKSSGENGLGKSKLIYQDEVSSKVKLSDSLPTKSKSKLLSNDQPLKSRTKSSLTIFSDENATSSSLSLSKEKKIPLSTIKPTPTPSSPKTRKSAPTPLSTSVSSQPIKRSRDLLSPLPILAPPISTSTSTNKSRIEIRRDDPNESPAKRNRTNENSNSTPIRQSRYTRGEQSEDKENLAPIFSPESINDSPATRTRSKIRSLTISSTQSPLRGSTSSFRVNRVNKVERLIGDGRNTLTLKKGRELAKLIDDADLDKEIRSLKGSPVKKSQGEIQKIEVLVDVSEAYGAKGDEPEGFKTQRR